LYGMSHGGASPPRDDPVPPDVTARVSRVQALPEHLLLVAVSGAEMIGYAWVQDYGPGLRRWWSVARLHDLYVAPGARRRGIGRALIMAVREWATGRETVKYLEWQASQAAVPFYERLGLQGDTRADLEEHPFFEITLR
ncbi:MAG: GNAT family N-acetyltransferase, partial [Chloroflexota bacterium]|nr:GNAT family N-acetyltransferase [Chloroflexota bacterium]